MRLNCKPEDATRVYTNDDKSYHSTLLHAAAEGGSVDIVLKVLGLSGLEIDALDHKRRTPLGVAAFYGHLKVIQILFKRRITRLPVYAPFLCRPRRQSRGSCIVVSERRFHNNPDSRSTNITSRCSLAWALEAHPSFDQPSS